jgi:hypothetical protein
MIERQTIEGRGATVAYLDRDFEPAGKDDWSLAKIIFDDGEIVFVRNAENDEAEDDG